MIKKCNCGRAVTVPAGSRGKAICSTCLELSGLEDAINLESQIESRPIPRLTTAQQVRTAEIPKNSGALVPGRARPLNLDEDEDESRNTVAMDIIIALLLMIPSVPLCLSAPWMLPGITAVYFGLIEGDGHRAMPYAIVSGVVGFPLHGLILLYVLSGPSAPPNPDPGLNYPVASSPSSITPDLTKADSNAPESYIRKIEVEMGTLIFTINRDKPNRLVVEFNNGLVAEVEWTRNPGSSSGYEISEPTTNRETYKFPLMIQLRAAITNYINGKYD